MSLIEGVGDEVTEFVFIVVCLVVAGLAWISTGARPDRFRTVVIMERNMRVRVQAAVQHPVTVNIRRNITLRLRRREAAPTAPAPLESAASSSNETVPEPVTQEPSSSGLSALQEMDSIEDADMAVMRDRRLHFYRRSDATTGAEGPTELADEDSDGQEGATSEMGPASSTQAEEMDSIVSAMDAGVAVMHDRPLSFFSTDEEASSADSTQNACANVTTPPSRRASVGRSLPRNIQKIINHHSGSSAENSKDIPPENKSTSGDAGEERVSAEGSTGAAEGRQNDAADLHSVNIKLKFLNDSSREVEGSLDELLKDFKWRHFSNELSSERRVRLIFNGRVLDDAATLRACGLQHGAVVHCLVHPSRAPQARVSTSEPLLGLEAPEPRAPPERPWDLENVLMTLVSVALTVVWFFRCEYSNMFTASASVALFGLTVFYSVAIFGLYLSDTFQFDRRNANPAPVPQN